MSDAKAQSHVCVLCNAKLASKEALQEHFRKHANREIDGKGRPRKAAVPGGIVANGPKKIAPPVTPQNLQRVNVPSRVVNKDAPTNTSGSSTSSSSCKSPASKNATTAGATKSPGKPSSGIVCDVCGQEFETVTIAIQHKFKKHPDSAIKHFCPHCGQQFPLKINRDKHLLVHPSGPPSQLFPCQECGVVFYNAQAQSYHFKSTHKRIVAIFKPVETPPPSKKIRMNNAGEAQSVYYCHICGYEYIIKFNLQKHIERHHSEEERNAIPEGIIKCTTCDALFYSKKAYDNHNMYHRPDDLYVTSEEQRLQTVSRVDQDFDIRRVQPGPEKFIPVNRPRPMRPNTSLAKMESKKSLGKFKGKKNNSQKTRRKEGRRPMKGSSDESDDSDASSESELSPDSGPDSDSDSDVPLKKCTKQQDAGKQPAPQGGGDAVKNKCRGTKRERKVMLKSQTMPRRKKVKVEASSSSSSEGGGREVGEGRGDGGVMGGGQQGSGERMRSRRGRDSIPESLRGLPLGNARGTAVLDEVKREVVNGDEDERSDSKVVMVKKEYCEEESKMLMVKREYCGESEEEPKARSGEGKSTVSMTGKGRGSKGNLTSGLGLDDRSCGGKGATVSKQVDNCAIKSEPSEEKECFESISIKKEVLSEDTGDRSS